MRIDYFARGSGGEVLRWVCLCVCLSDCSRAYLRSHTRDLFQLFVHVAYGRGSVLLWQGNEIPQGRGNFGGFHPQWQRIVTLTLQITSYINRDHSASPPGSDESAQTACAKCDLRLPCCPLRQCSVLYFRRPINCCRDDPLRRGPLIGRKTVTWRSRDRMMNDSQRLEHLFSEMFHGGVSKSWGRSGVLGEGSEPTPHQLRVWGERCKLPSGVRSPGRNWCRLMLIYLFI